MTNDDPRDAFYGNSSPLPDQIKLKGHFIISCTKCNQKECAIVDETCLNGNPVRENNTLNRFAVLDLHRVGS